MPAFAYWKGKIKPYSRSSEIVSSLDLFPTLSTLAGLELPKDRIYDGRDMSDILLLENNSKEGNKGGKSRHDFLFFYGTCNVDTPYWSVSGVRHGKYKAHWCTAPGIGSNDHGRKTRMYDPPLLFNVEDDPSESLPINYEYNDDDKNEKPRPMNSENTEAMRRIIVAYAMEKATFEFGTAVPFPDGPGEGPGLYGICCDRSKNCNCSTDDKDADDDKKIDDSISSSRKVKPQLLSGKGLFNLGTKKHHDKYHEVLGEDEPSPPRTQAQIILSQK